MRKIMPRLWNQGLREELLAAIVAESRGRFTEALKEDVAGSGGANEKIYLLGERLSISLHEKPAREDEGFGLLRSPSAELAPGCFGDEGGEAGVRRVIGQAFC